MGKLPVRLKKKRKKKDILMEAHSAEADIDLGACC